MKKLDLTGDDTEVVNVRPNELLPHPDNRKVIEKEEEFEDLVRSMKSHGFTSMITVREVDAGDSLGLTYQILAGHRRVRAALKAGIAKIAATVLKLDDAAAYRYVVGENLHRRNFTGMELYDIVTRFREQGLKAREIATHMSKSKSWVDDVFRIKRVDKATRKLARKGGWSLNKLVTIATRNIAEDVNPDAEEKVEVAPNTNSEVRIYFNAYDYKRLMTSMGKTEKRIQTFNDTMVRAAMKWSLDTK